MMTGKIVGMPPIVSVVTVFAVHSEFVTADVEKPGGGLVMVTVCEGKAPDVVNPPDNVNVQEAG